MITPDFLEGAVDLRTARRRWSLVRARFVSTTRHTWPESAPFWSRLSKALRLEADRIENFAGLLI